MMLGLGILPLERIENPIRAVEVLVTEIPSNELSVIVLSRMKAKLWLFTKIPIRVVSLMMLSSIVASPLEITIPDRPLVMVKPLMVMPFPLMVTVFVVLSLPPGRTTGVLGSGALPIRMLVVV